ncbi:cell wall hydrolase [Sphingomonas sp. SUN019]|uniref:cell wall hydrolase n=1 Tax=Sphingomonas sp. SUN019 TaxID=2937788 RepID=UPI0021643596|nr:cell wall hydrolase [Sphingomonas sp. SUN019]UVO51159.1 cell wall hydrolase [Sphingomonas sp. SUN019]
MTAAALHSSQRAADRARSARAWRQAAVIAAPIVACISVAALAGLSLIAPETVSAATAGKPGGRTETLAARTKASPAIGTTGTAELPPEPVGAPAPVTFDVGVTAAQPFAARIASSIDRARALECLTAAIYYEAASESDDGQRAVAQVVLNRVRHPAFPATVCGVVYQGSERSSGCQFSFACDDAMTRVPSRNGWSRAARTAALALSGQVFAPVGLATHYHTYAVTPAWNRTLVMTDAIGAHFFHRWKGYWGTSSAFHQTYRGGEPLPGPHPQTTPAPILAPVVLAATAPATVIPMVQPAHSDGGAPLRPTTDEAAPESQILDRWKDSGKPLQ